MKIIDFHIHIGLKEHWHDWVHEFQRNSGSDFYTHYEVMIDPGRFSEYLQKQGLFRAVILPEISPITTGIVPNEYVFEFCQGRDIFLPFCTVNPTLVERPERELDKYIQMGARGIKLYPSYNHFFPNDPQLYPLYETAEKNGLPVLVHTGSSIFKGSKIKYSDPIHLDDVAADFPGLPLLMAHGGRGLWYDRAFFLSSLHPNLHLEVSGLPPQNLLKYFPRLEEIVDKVVFGSDFPGVRSIASNIETIQGLPLAEESKRKILFDNARRILNLEGKE